MPIRNAYIKTIFSYLQCSYMDTFIMLSDVKVPLPFLKRRFVLARNECVICRKKKNKKGGSGYKSQQ